MLIRRLPPRSLSCSRGFSLVELLVVFVVIGVIAGIAIPYLLNAYHRGKQKKTMADIRSIGLAAEAYTVDIGMPPQRPAGGAARDIRALLEPTYIQMLPLQDGWNIDFAYWAEASFYSVRSFGKDGVTEGDVGPAETRRYTCDVIFSNGQFVRYPDGSQD